MTTKVLQMMPVVSRSASTARCALAAACAVVLLAGCESMTGNLGKKMDRDINISAGNPVIMGSLDKELIRRVIEAHKAQIRYCYEKALVRTPGLFGKIDMEWTITGEGRVSDSKPKGSTMQNPEVERCIAEKIRTWEFPKPKGGGIVVVRYPFVFKTAG